MKILIVGADDSLSQAAMAALVQAGFISEVEVVQDIKVAINVSGGIVQDVASNVPLSAQVFDYDNPDDDDRPQEDWPEVKREHPIPARQ